MSKDLNLALRIKADLQQAITQLKAIDKSLDETNLSAKKAGAGLKVASSSTEKLRKEVNQLPALLRTITGLMATAFSVKEISAAAETYAQIRNRLALVTNGSQELANAQDAVFQAAQAARQPLGATAELYQRIATNADQLKLSAAGVAGVVSTVNKTLAISGTSSAASEAALVQLGQALAADALRGDELNSILEQAPALAKTLASGLGVSVGQLRKLGSEGKLTAQNIIQALQSQAGAVDQQFQKIAVTGSQSLTVLGNSLIKVVGDIDAATGSSAGFAKVITGLSQYLDSGQLTSGLVQSLSIWSSVFSAVGQDIEGLGANLDGVVYAGDETVKFLIQAFKEMPANLRSAIQIATVEILAIFDKTIAYAGYVADNIEAIFTSKTQNDALAEVERRYAEINKVREESIVTILAERDAILKNGEAAKQKFSEEKAAREKARLEREKEIAALNQKAASQSVKFGTDPQVLKAAEDYVKSLEKQVLQINAGRAAVNDYENDQKKLTGTLLEQARAFQKARDAAKDKEAIESLEILLLKGQGNENAAAEAEFKQRYRNFLRDLTGDTAEKGKELVAKLLDLIQLNNNLDEAKKLFNQTLDDISREENRVNVQREAGLISEYEARDRLYKLSQEEAKKLEEIRPKLEALTHAPETIAVAARAALAALDDQIVKLNSTMTLLQSTLREGLENGLTTAIQGLAEGTLTLRDAIGEVARSVGQALERMAAQAIAQKLVSKIPGLGGSDNMEAGAEKTTQAAVALGSAATAWSIVAGQIQAAAVALQASSGTAAVAGASGGGGGGGGGGSGWLNLFATVASVFAADGGHVTGPGTTTSDSIPAMLSNNEYVTRAAVVMQPNAKNFLDDFNKHGMAALRAWAPAYHSTGGLAGVPAPAMPSPTLGNSHLTEPSNAFNATLKNNQNFYLVDDPSRITDVMNSPAGHESIAIAMKRDPAKFRSILQIQG